MKRKIEIDQEKDKKLAQKIANRMLGDKEFYNSCVELLHHQAKDIQAKANSKFYVNKTPLGFENNDQPFLFALYITLAKQNQHATHENVEKWHKQFLAKTGGDQYMVVPRSMQKILMPILPMTLGQFHITNVKHWMRRDLSWRFLININLAHCLINEFASEFTKEVDITPKTATGIRID